MCSHATWWLPVTTSSSSHRARTRVGAAPRSACSTPTPTSTCGRVEVPRCDAPAWALVGPSGTVRARRPARCLRAAARPRAVGHQCRPQHGSSDPALGHGGRRAHRAELRREGPRRERRGRRALAVGHRRDDRRRSDRRARRRAPRSVLNLNVPALAREQVKGLRWARLAAFGAVRAAIATAESDGRLQIELRATERDAPARHGYRAVRGRLRDAHHHRRHRGVVADRAADRRRDPTGGPRRGLRPGARPCPTRPIGTRCTAASTPERRVAGASRAATRRTRRGQWGRKSTSSRFTRSGASHCSQCPTPSTRS